MTILTPELVDEIEERIYLFAVLGHAIGTTDALLASHRAQAAEIKRMEKRVKELEIIIDWETGTNMEPKTPGFLPP